MITAIVALIAGVLVGWSVATGEFWLALVAAVLAVAFFALERTRLVDRRASTAAAASVSPSPRNARTPDESAARHAMARSDSRHSK